MMSDAGLQTAMSISIPTFAVLVGILINNSRLSDLRAHMDARFADSEHRWDMRFEDLKETWRSELRRVEDVLDARLKHLEER
jgi:hypothetical protein